MAKSPDKQSYVVLRVIDGKEGIMATYGPQIACIQKFDSMEDAACFNVGSHPAARERGRPYRTVVIPAEHWNEFLVYSNTIRGNSQFEAVPNGEPTIKPPHQH